MDQLDYKIVELLKNNAKLNNVELGKLLHISSQAVGVRRTRLENQKIITKYTIESILYKTAFIEVYLNSNQFTKFEQDILSLNKNCTLHKISGSFCYLLIYEEIIEEFDRSLLEILIALEKHARYKVNTSIKQLNSY